MRVAIALRALLPVPAAVAGVALSARYLGVAEIIVGTDVANVAAVTGFTVTNGQVGNRVQVAGLGVRMTGVGEAGARAGAAAHLIRAQDWVPKVPDFAPVAETVKK